MRWNRYFHVSYTSIYTSAWETPHIKNRIITEAYTRVLHVMYGHTWIDNKTTCCYVAGGVQLQNFRSLSADSRTRSPPPIAARDIIACDRGGWERGRTEDGHLLWPTDSWLHCASTLLCGREWLSTICTYDLLCCNVTLHRQHVHIPKEMCCINWQTYNWDNQDSSRPQEKQMLAVWICFTM